MRSAIICLLLISIVSFLPRAALSAPVDTNFISQGLHRFGETEAEVRAALGEPASVTEEESKNAYIEGGVDVIRTLEYNGVSVAVMHAANGNEFVERVTITSSGYKFDGISVGSAKEEVIARLGEPESVEGDSLYYSSSFGAAAVRFYFSGGVVTKIVFMSTT